VAFDAGKSLDGGAALGGTVGGQAREQEAWSPVWVLDAAREALGGRIVLDPCGASAWCLPEVCKVDKQGRRQVARAFVEGGWFADVTLTGLGGYAGHSPHGGWCAEADGLAVDWCQAGAVYVNPPYNVLGDWLAKILEAARAGCKVVALFPARPRRQWWCDATLKCPQAQTVFLSYDVRFQGYAQAHPENMCLVGWNCRIPLLGTRETWRT
jgi:hypothetical protein